MADLNSTDVSNILAIIAAGLPDVIAFIKGLHAARHPGTPLPTDAEVKAALVQAGIDSIAADEAWKVNHPA